MSHSRNNLINKAKLDDTKIDHVIDLIEKDSIDKVMEYAIDNNMISLLSFTLNLSASKYLTNSIISNNLSKYSILNLKVEFENKPQLEEIKKIFETSNCNTAHLQRVENLIKQSHYNSAHITNKELLSIQDLEHSLVEESFELLSNSSKHFLQSNQPYFVRLLDEEEMGKNIYRNRDSILRSEKFKNEIICKTDASKKNIKNNFEKSPNYCLKYLEELETNLKDYNLKQHSIKSSLHDIKYRKFESDLNEILLSFATFEIAAQSSDMESLSKIKLNTIEASKKNSLNAMLEKIHENLPALKKIIMLAAPLVTLWHNLNPEAILGIGLAQLALSQLEIDPDSNKYMTGKISDDAKNQKEIEDLRVNILKTDNRIEKKKLIEDLNIKAMTLIAEAEEVREKKKEHLQNLIKNSRDKKNTKRLNDDLKIVENMSKSAIGVVDFAEDIINFGLSVQNNNSNASESYSSTENDNDNLESVFDRSEYGQKLQKMSLKDPVKKCIDIVQSINNIGLTLKKKVASSNQLTNDQLDALCLRAFKKAYELQKETHYNYSISRERRDLSIEEYRKAICLVVILIDKGAELKVDSYKNEDIEIRDSKNKIIKKNKRFNPKERAEIENFYIRFNNLSPDSIISILINNIKVFDKFSLKESNFYKKYIESSVLTQDEREFLFTTHPKIENLFKILTIKLKESQSWIENNKNQSGNLTINYFKSFLFFISNLQMGFDERVSLEESRIHKYKEIIERAQLNDNLEDFFIFAKDLMEETRNSYWEWETPIEEYINQPIGQILDIIRKIEEAKLSKDDVKINALQKELEKAFEVNFASSVSKNFKKFSLDLKRDEEEIIANNEKNITIDNLTNTLQQQVQKINEAQAATEQERAAKERKKNRTKKGKELQENGKTAEANYIIFYDSDEDDKEKYTAFVNNNYSFTGLEDVFPHEQSP